MPTEQTSNPMQHKEQFQQCFEQASALVALRRAEAPVGFDPINGFFDYLTFGLGGGALKDMFSNEEEAPATPDYAAANRAGVLASAEMLPLQKKIEASAKLGM